MYIITRTSEWNHDIEPIKEAYQKEFTMIHWCPCKTLEETKTNPNISWFWRDKMFGQEKIKGQSGVVAYSKEIAWVTDLTIEELLKKYGDLVVKSSDYKEVPIAVEIYDEYRE